MGRACPGDDGPAEFLLERQDRQARATSSRGTAASGGLKGPVFRQHGAELLVLGIVGVFLLESLDLLEQIILIHFEHVGDHTRGLFEAEASVAPSAPHPLHDRAIFGVHRTRLALPELELCTLGALYRSQRGRTVTDP